MLRVTQFKGTPPDNKNPKPKSSLKFGTVVVQAPDSAAVQSIIHTLNTPDIIGTRGPGFVIKISGAPTNDNAARSKLRNSQALIIDSRSSLAARQAQQEKCLIDWLNQAFPSYFTWLATPSKDFSRGHSFVEDPSKPADPLATSTTNPFTVVVPRVEGFI